MQVLQAFRDVSLADKGVLPRLLGLLAAGGGLVGYLVVPPRAPTSAPFRNADFAITLEGKPLSLAGGEKQTRDMARSIARNYLREKFTLAIPGGAEASLPREDLGVVVDSDRLRALVTSLGDPNSPLRRAHVGKGPNSPLALPLPVRLDERRSLYAVLQLKDEADKPPADARLELEHHTVSPDEPGRRLDAYATLGRIEDAIDRGTVHATAVVESLKAARTAEALRDAHMDDVLGYFETRYASDLKHEARTFNLRLAASKLSGYVLMPGEVFDFNEIVGARNEVNGYKVAPVIAQGELVDGVGGGTCQIAGTLHGAAFFAGLDIVERHPHTRPSFYIKMGLDAAVAYPTITLRFRNPFSFPIAVRETVIGGTVRAEVLGPTRTRDVTFVRKINDVTPFQEKENPDPRLPKGARVLAQRGIPSFKITRYRIVRDGPFAIRERSTDIYPATSQIWRVGTGDPDPDFIAQDDPHPEYVADDYLTILQGPNITSPKAKGPERGGGMVESRVAGRYGTYGWTVREGFAKPFPPSQRRGTTGDGTNTVDKAPVD